MASKKSASKSASGTTKTSEVMDPTVREASSGTAHTNNARVAGALKALAGEVSSLFPETKIAYGGYDGRNTALDASFDLSDIPTHDAVPLMSALLLVKDDHRVEYITEIDDETVRVTLRSNARTQDSPESFRIVEALAVLTEGSGPVADENDPLGLM